MTSRPTFSAAVDLGATSGRVIVGAWSGRALRLHEVHRFPNQFRSLGSHDYWEIGTLWSEVQAGLAKAKAAFPRLASVGVDTWAVDYALVTRRGRLVQPVHAYRDLRTQPAHKALRGAALDRIYALTGVPNFAYNTSLQLQESLRAFPALAQAVDRCLFLPDYFNFLLTGRLANEISISSHAQLLDVHGDNWSPAALKHFGIPARWFSRPARSPVRLGSVRGSDALAGLLGLMVPGHDTACAFTAMPADPTGADLYLSTGTWCLLGFESAVPVLGREALRSRISNERMGDGRFRPLCSGPGLWLLERVFAEGIRKPANPAEWDQLVAAAAALPRGKATLDLDDGSFFNPPSMTAAIATAARRAGLRPPRTPAEYMRLVVDSIAAHQAAKARLLARLSGRTFRRILVVGGGSNNHLLCQSIADAAGLPVHSLQLEGSAVGNLACQFIALDAVASLASFRAHLARALPARIHSPNPS